MCDLAHLEGRRADGTFKWCIFPCQMRNPDGSRIDRECRVAVKPHVVVGGRSWDVSGPPDAPTLSPSVNCDEDRCWHGFIENGWVKNPSGRNHD